MIHFDHELTGDFDLYDLDEVAEQTGLSRNKVSQAVQLGLLAGVQHGGKWMVISEEVERFRVQCQSPATVGNLAHQRRSRRFYPPRPAITDVAG